MKEQIIQILKTVENPVVKKNILQEYLQAFVLRSLHESEAFQNVSFVGETALRFLYALPRFSEDLDFSLENKKSYKPEKWLKKLKSDFSFATFKPVISWNEKNTVQSGWIKIPEVLKDIGLSDIAAQNISIKIEIDTNPPKGAALESSIINKHFLMTIRHHDLSSLMAGKIHALTFRKYVKGRDFYDFLWYRSQIPPIEPNLILLQNAINQTQPGTFLAKNWKTHLLNQFKKTDFESVVKDVEIFLENKKDADLLHLENFKNLLSS